MPTTRSFAPQTSPRATIHVAVKASEQRLLQRAAAAAEVPLSVWLREIAVVEASKIIARDLVGDAEGGAIWGSSGRPRRWRAGRWDRMTTSTAASTTSMGRLILTRM